MAALQLVGRDCVLCNERIASVLDGSFCATCGCPVHSDCAWSNTTRSGACTTCGAAAELIAAHRPRLEEEATDKARDLQIHHWGWGLTVFGTGLVLFAVGIVTVLGTIYAIVEDLPFFLWHGAVIVGAVLMFRGILHFRAARNVKRESEWH